MRRVRFADDLRPKQRRCDAGAAVPHLSVDDLSPGAPVRRLRHALRATAAVALLSLAGCPRLKAKPAEETVYVTAKQAFLRDRVAAVSNRTGSVENGEKLKVLDHGRHFIKVQTPKGEVGWIEEKQVATDETAADFQKLADEHKLDSVIASAVVRDQVYLHLKPGRETPHFYLLEENDKLQLLKRAIVTRVVSGENQAKVQKAIPQAVGSNAARPKGQGAPATPAAEAPQPVYEDWWLVRDAHGQAGWMLSRMMDVDAPDQLIRYAEGQRIVGAYQLAVVHDDGAPTDQKDIPEFVTVLSPYKAGLPYDFDQVRIFIWSLNHHRYETAFREHNIEGYLPIKIATMKDPYGKSQLAGEMLPAFTYRVLAADAPAPQPDPETGVLKPAKLITKTYRLEGNQVHRLLKPDEGTPEEAHPVAEEKKDKKKR